MTEELLKKLRAAVPSAIILTSDDDCTNYGMDWTRTPGKAGVVVLPSSTQDVSVVLRFCNENKIAVIPSGGRTGLAGGVTATRGELAINMSRMNRLDPVDLLGRTVRVQAGVTTQSLHEHCERAGLTWPIDLASKGTSQIGGNLATNAGGVRVIRYGMARRWVSAIQAVLISGEVIELNQGLEKNNTGYDLLQLLIGSEGTLAIITEATLKLTVPPIHSHVFFFSLSHYKALENLYEKVRRGPFTLTSFEFFSDKCLQKVEAKLQKKSRLEKPSRFYALIDVETTSENAQSKVDGWLEDLMADEIVVDGLIADASESQKEVWALRESITESLQMSGAVRKYDLCVPVKKAADFLDEAQALFEKLNLPIELYVFGHFGDGSPHLNFLNAQNLPIEDFHREVNRYESELYPLLKAYSGSVSAEHGVGILKKNWVLFSRTPQELRLYKAVKQVFDPNGILNPGKIID